MQLEKLKTDIRLLWKKTENINYQHKEVLQRIILNVYYISIYLLCVSVMQGDPMPQSIRRSEDQLQEQVPPLPLCGSLG